MLLYIVEAKKGCKKKSLSILSLVADLLKCKISMHIILLICYRCLKMKGRASKTLTFAGLICAVVLLYHSNSIYLRDINHKEAQADDIQDDTGDET